jgi:hypothetical protein
MFVDSVIARLSQFPVPPMTRLHQIRDSLSSEHEKTLCRELFIRMGGKPYRIPGKSYDLQPDDPTLERYEFLLHKLEPSYAKLPQRNRNAATAQRLQLFATIEKEQAIWTKQYQASFACAAPTLYSFQDARIDAALRRILHGEAPRPKMVKAAMRMSNAVQRQRRHRKNKKSFPKMRHTGHRVFASSK